MLTPQEERRAAEERRRYWDRRLEEIADGDDEALAKYHEDWDAEQQEEWGRDQEQKEFFGMAMVLLLVAWMAFARACVG
jgi:hypothetical protein